MARTTSMETITSERSDIDLIEDKEIPQGSDRQVRVVKEHNALTSTELANQAFSWIEELDQMRTKSGNI